MQITAIPAPNTIDAILHVTTSNKGTMVAGLWTHKRHPISHPHGRAIGRLLWVPQRKITTGFQECIVYVSHYQGYNKRHGRQAQPGSQVQGHAVARLGRADGGGHTEHGQCRQIVSEIHREIFKNILQFIQVEKSYK